MVHTNVLPAAFSNIGLDDIMKLNFISDINKRMLKVDTSITHPVLARVVAITKKGMPLIPNFLSGLWY